MFLTYTIDQAAEQQALHQSPEVSQSLRINEVITAFTLLKTAIQLSWCRARLLAELFSF